MRKYYLFLFFCQFVAFEINAQVNYDENKVPEFELPALLPNSNGDLTSDKIIWEQERRKEILSLFEEHVFGTFPKEGLTFSHKLVDNIPEAIDGIVDLKNIILKVSNGDKVHEIGMSIFLPHGVSGPVPVFLGYNFYGNHTTHKSTFIPITKSYVRNNESFNISNNKATETSRGVRAHRWPVADIVSRGYGLAVMYYGDVDPDFDDGFENGIHALLDLPHHEMPSSIEAWALGLSLAMDYLKTDDQINKDQVAVIGHSRLGKAALWAGVRDERFAMVISNDSGCGGAALSRRRFGETVAIINKSFPHWFNAKFKTYSNNEDALPIDQHMLLALVAPRPLYVASASEDLWADPRGEFLSLIEASEIYKLYNQEVMDPNTQTTLNQSIFSGKTAYHLREGKHDITSFDWEKYMDFADLQFLK